MAARLGAALCVCAAALLAACSLLLPIQESDSDAGTHSTGGAAGGKPGGGGTGASGSGGQSASGGSGGTSGGSGGVGAAGGASGASASGGMAGNDASAGAGGTITCPSGTGPTMVNMGQFCIDSTEVTKAQYHAFLLSNPDASQQPAYCSWNTSFFSGTPPDTDEAVVDVDWCDSFAYCAWAGKRMCGKIGGGSVNYNGGWASAAESEWMFACSNGGTTKYPYGNAFDYNACNGWVDSGPLVVQSFPLCHGISPPFDAVYDMSGDAYEWEDACDLYDGASDICKRRGGSSYSNESQLACDGVSSVTTARNFTGSTTGIRCCAY